MFIKINTRLKAFLFHILISSVILAVLLFVILYFWFPEELVHAGAKDGLKIIIGVDMVLGPLLTLMVFNPTKKSLKFDLTIIGLIQLACLIAGTWLLYNERPVAQVLADDGIHLITQGDLNLYESSLPGLKSKARPSFYFLDLPTDWSEIPAIKMSTELADEKPLAYRTDLLLSIDKVNQQTFTQRIININGSSETKKSNADRPELHSELKCDWVPVISIHVTGQACIDKERGVIKLSDRTRFLPLLAKTKSQ